MIGAAALIVPAGGVSAQASPSGGLEIASQEVRRGLSWSDRRASVSADATLPFDDVDLSARVTVLRGSARHRGSDAVADLGAAWTTRAGGLALTARTAAHLFAGGSGPRHYADVGGVAAYAYGPLQVDAGVTWAPSQRAIGGSNLYLSAGASAGVPGTPFTVSAAAGHSSGGNGLRADRLRPGGNYADWRLGVDRVSGRLTLGLDYTGTDLPRGVADGRDRLVARARLSF